MSSTLSGTKAAAGTSVRGPERPTDPEKDWADARRYLNTQPKVFAVSETPRNRGICAEHAEYINVIETL